MATPEVIAALTAAAQDCLEDKLQAGFDANAQLTVDIAKELMSSVEAASAEYTDIEISKVLDLIDQNEVDLEPFLTFMTSIKSLLDGDDLADGWQIFDLLAIDANDVSSGLILQTTTINNLQTELSTFQTSLDDHTARITALELAQHEPVDCEDCHDDFLDILKGSISDACADAAVAQATYQTTTSATIMDAWREELAEVVITHLRTDASAVNGSHPVRYASVTGYGVAAVKMLNNSTGLLVDMVLTDGEWVGDGAADNEGFTIYAYNAAGDELGSLAQVATTTTVGA